MQKQHALVIQSPAKENFSVLHSRMSDGSEYLYKVYQHRGQLIVQSQSLEEEKVKAIFYDPKLIQNEENALIRFRRGRAKNLANSTKKPLKVQEVTLSEWHQASGDGDKLYRTFSIPSGGEVVEIDVIEGQMLGSRRARYLSSQCVNSLGWWLHRLKGSTTIVGVVDPGEQSLTVIDITRLAGICLLATPKSERLAMLSRVGVQERPYFYTYHRYIPEGGTIASFWGDDSELAKNAYEDRCDLLSFSLGFEAKEESGYLRASPIALLICRVLFRAQHDALNSIYGLGLLCPETGQEPFAGSILTEDYEEFELDSLVRVKTFVGLDPSSPILLSEDSLITGTAQGATQASPAISEP